MEAALGGNFADVRVHVGSHVSALGALAFTRGAEIHFAPGQFQPATVQGRMLIAHELVHVLQQRAGRVRNPFGQGVALVQDPGLEAEANRLAARTAVQPRTAPQPGQIQPATAPWPRRFSVLQAMPFKDIKVDHYYFVKGTSRKLESKANGWLQFEGLPNSVRASDVTGPAPKPTTKPTPTTPTTATVPAAPSLKRKFEASSNYPFRNDAYSDSEEDLDSDFEKEVLGEEYEQPQAKKGGYKKQEVKLFNASKWHPQKNIRELGIDNTVRDPSGLPPLEADAKAIHAAAKVSRPAAFTVVCALLLTKKKALKKFCFNNLDSTISPGSRDEAHRRGYHVIYANQAHAEAEMAAYLKSRGYQLVSMGCDKPHCPECNRLTRDVNGGNYPTESAVDKGRTNPFKSYYLPPGSSYAWKQEIYEKSDEHRPSQEAGFRLTDDFSQAPDLGKNLGFSPSPSPVSRNYYSSPNDKKRLKLAP